eukprot:768500-Hanusia_phi.AAC.7
MPSCGSTFLPATRRQDQGNGMNARERMRSLLTKLPRGDELQEANATRMLRSCLAALLHDNQTDRVKRILSFDEQEDRDYQLSEAFQVRRLTMVLLSRR